MLKIIQNTDVFKFGDFLTKSGRISPYYLNLGSLYNTRFFNNLVDLYCEVIVNIYGEKVDNIFGPSYKGIPLAVSASNQLSQILHKDVSFTFDRKEKK